MRGRKWCSRYVTPRFDRASNTDVASAGSPCRPDTERTCKHNPSGIITFSKLWIYCQQCNVPSAYIVSLRTCWREGGSVQSFLENRHGGLSTTFVLGFGILRKLLYNPLIC